MKSEIAAPGAGRARLFRPALVYSFTSALSAGVPFLLLPVLTRLLSPDEYGQIAMFSVVVTLLGGIVGLNVQSSLPVRYFEKDPAGFPRYVGACLLVLAVSGAVVLCLTVLLLPWLEAIAKLPGEWLLIAVIVSASQFLIQTQLGIWQAATRPWAYGTLRIGLSLLDGLTSLLLVVAFALGWQGRAGGIAIAVILTGMIAACLLLRGKWVKFSGSAQDVSGALRFGVPLIPHVIGAMLIAMVDRVMITNVLDTASTGIYMVAVQIGMVLGLGTESFNRAYAPWLLEVLNQDQPARDRSIVRFTYLYFAIVSAVALILGLAAPSILAVLVGEQFRAAAPIVFYVTFGFAFGGMYFMVTNYVFFARRTTHLAAVTVCCGIFNVGLSYWLIHRHGVVGAAQAFMIAQATLFVATWWLANRMRPMPWRRALFSAA